MYNSPKYDFYFWMWLTQFEDKKYWADILSDLEDNW